MNCRDFLLEFEERRGDLTEAATMHVKICVECAKTSGEQTRVWLMIDNLQRIDAPNDFDFRVKAKIANSKPADFEPRFLPALRYVLPVCLVVLLLGFVAFNANYFSGGEITQQIAATTPEKVTVPVNSFAANQAVPANSGDGQIITESANVNAAPNANLQENQLVAVKFPSKQGTGISKKNVTEEGGGSRISSVSSPLVTLPVGIEPNRKVETSPNAVSSNMLTDEEVWEFIGIEVALEKGSRKVIAVRQDTTAERSGVKVGDVIEAINGEKLSAKPIRAKKIEAKTLTIARGTEKIEIALKN